MRNHAWMQRLARLCRSIGVALVAASITGMSGAGAAGESGSIADTGATGADAAVTLVGTADASAPGRTPTEFGVSHSGAATYRIPLWTPPGVGEVGLELALVYASRGGSGSVGVGWSIAGLSTITRCNRTWAQDGAAAAVTNTFADRYCLDGQQLKLVSGTHGMAGAVYATEVETFSRIVANGAAGNGPASFTVTTRNGLIHEYGGTVDSRAYAGASTTIRAWALSRVRDRAGVGTGNAITLTYANEAQYGAYTNGTHRIASIAYPTTATGAGPFYRVDFAYSARPSSDVPTGYLAGNLVRDPYRLDRITVQAMGAATPIKSYALGYETAPVSGRLRLASVQECAVTKCLQPTAITYQNGASGWQPMVDTGVAVSTTRAPVPIELNGDGVTDLLYPVAAGTGTLSWRILLGTPLGFAAPLDTGLVTTNAHAIIPGAFAGNGRTQFLFVQNGYWHVAGYTNAGFTVANTGLVPAGEYGAADFDGDGLADLMAQTGGFTPTINVRRNVGVPSSTALAVQFATTAQPVWTIPSLRQGDALGQPACCRSQRRRSRGYRCADLQQLRPQPEVLRHAVAVQWLRQRIHRRHGEAAVAGIDGDDGRLERRRLLRHPPGAQRVRLQLRWGVRRTRDRGNGRHGQYAVHGAPRGLERRRPRRPAVHRCRDATVVRRALDRRRRGGTRQHGNQRTRRPPPGSTWTPTATDSPISATATATTATGCATCCTLAQRHRPIWRHRSSTASACARTRPTFRSRAATTHA